MSYNIGPFMGKPAALTAAVKEQVAKYEGMSRTEAEAAAAFILPQLAAVDPARTTTVAAYGSASFGHVQHSINVGHLPVPGHITLPLHVE